MKPKKRNGWLQTLADVHERRDRFRFNPLGILVPQPLRFGAIGRRRCCCEDGAVTCAAMEVFLLDISSVTVTFDSGNTLADGTCDCCSSLATSSVHNYSCVHSTNRSYFYRENQTCSSLPCFCGGTIDDDTQVYHSVTIECLSYESPVLWMLHYSAGYKAVVSSSCSAISAYSISYYSDYNLSTSPFPSSGSKKIPLWGTSGNYCSGSPPSFLTIAW